MANRFATAGRRMFIGHTTAVAYLALLLASSSAVYAAATVGSAEVINNSLHSVDLKDGAAVTGADVVNDSMAGADVNESTLNGVGRKLTYNGTTTQEFIKTTLLTVANYTFKASCQAISGGVGPTILRFHVTGPAGDYQRSLWWATNDSSQASDGDHDPGGAFFPAATDTLLFNRFAEQANYERGSGTLWIHSGATLLRVDLHALADRRTDPGKCMLYGTITRAV